eukprot:gnl/TRDRNA2_/TRDRNA2_183550_c0_seq1.p1 gnl/TRDRNA2_/TRDRNA2_183550_c0~~gnl/TRDRNA2_/TRDRNA2_183550_c0_seq1.p1  ORF type:complete len:539 (-),score=76.78 gnl/TRDRNA2_/TRDRNA2_183550_c0_seq1:110-1726(-)
MFGLLFILSVAVALDSAYSSPCCCDHIGGPDEVSLLQLRLINKLSSESHAANDTSRRLPPKNYPTNSTSQTPTAVLSKSMSTTDGSDTKITILPPSESDDGRNVQEDKASAVLATAVLVVVVFCVGALVLAPVCSLGTMTAVTIWFRSNPVVGMFSALLFHMPLAFFFLTSWTLLYLVLWIPLRIMRKITRMRLKSKVSSSDGGGLCLPHLILEAALAFSSWLHYRCMVRGYVEMKKLMKHHLVQQRLAAGNIWYSPFEEDLALSNTGRLSDYWISCAHVVGPRWNTHCNAHLAYVSLPSGSGTYAFEVENRLQTGVCWQIIVYSMSDEVIAEVYPRKDVNGNIIVHVETDCDCVQLMARMYFFGETKEAPFPKIWLGGTEVVGSKMYKKDFLSFNQLLRESELLWHSAMHWYIFPMLMSRAWLPKKVVRREYLSGLEFLPVSTMENACAYGVLLEGYSLAFGIDSTLFENYLVYCTQMSRGSMPTIASYEVTLPNEEMPVSKEDGFWMVRVVAKHSGPTDEHVLDQVKTILVKADDA